MTIFLSASLLFFVQPLFTKVVLPHVGGAPAVWTTAMLFFQTVLIGGYLYAHIITRHLSMRAQIGLHLSLWALALIFLPLAVAEGWSYDAEKSTAWQTLMLFAGGVGLPFAVLSANAPLIQSWYARSNGYSSDDPYFLYGASNLGSLIALLGFPLVAEPLFGATQIGWGWTIGFWTLGALLLCSGLMVGKGTGTVAQAPQRSAAPSLVTRFHWGLIAFVPSSLMLAVTTKLSTDVGSVPLVWVIPLALFLLTFVLVFTNKPIVSNDTLRLGYLLGLGGLAAVFSNLMGLHVSIPSAVLTVAAFFLAALYAHALLYAARPSPEHLTTFYVTMSVGGALGGFFNSIVAPNLFNELHEGAITVAIAALLLLDAKSKPSRLAIWAACGLALLLSVQGPFTNVAGPTVLAILSAGLLVVIATTIRAHHQAQALVILSVLVVGQTFANHETPLLSDRSFFGAHKIVERDGLRIYGNGTTTHGAQRIADLNSARPEPQFYYHKNGPMAQVLTSATGTAAQSVGIVGLGIGALACYGKPHQDWHFYEIDALVDQIARDPRHFTFMDTCAPDAPTYLGDARMVLADQDQLTFDILVLDAYSSDSVPVHLTTYEALELYMNRLGDDGLLIFHISNRYYDIGRPLGRIAEALGLEARIQNYAGNKTDDPGDVGSVVVAMARSQDALGVTLTDPRWKNLPSDGGRVWSDDFANVLEILNR
ncbi:MAG: transporter [Marinosulfonomonas sp.]